MSDQFLGEIRPFACNFAPAGWAFCNGQILAISQNTALFSLLGTNYGGNGTSNFGLPNLQSQVPIHQGNGSGLSTYFIGEQGGVETVVLNSSHLPQHTHTFQGGALTGKTANAYLATDDILCNTVSPNFFYAADSNTLVPLNPASVALAGSGQAHSNIQPVLAINYCIALSGIFPARN